MKSNIYYILLITLIVIAIIYVNAQTLGLVSWENFTIPQLMASPAPGPAPAPSPGPAPAEITTTTNKMDMISPGGAVYMNQQQLLQQLTTRMLTIQNTINQINSYLPRQIADIVPGMISTGDASTAMINIRNVPYSTIVDNVLTQTGSNPIQIGSVSMPTGKWFIDMVLPQGAQGAKGAQGPVGPQGISGIQGEVGSQGPRGPWGKETAV